MVREDSDRVSARRSDDGFEFTFDDGTSSKFITIRTEEEWLDHHEAADMDILKASIDGLVDQVWANIRQHINDGKVWFLTTPKLWFSFRAGKVELRAWCCLVS